MGQNRDEAFPDGSDQALFLQPLADPEALHDEGLPQPLQDDAHADRHAPQDEVDALRRLPQHPDCDRQQENQPDVAQQRCGHGRCLAVGPVPAAETAAPDRIGNHRGGGDHAPEQVLGMHPVAVPEGGQQPDQQDVHHSPAQSCPGTAQGDVDIVLEEAHQRHVPAAVVVADRAGNIGIVEVLRQAVAQRPGDAHGHEGVGLPVQEDLQAGDGGAEPGQLRGDRLIADGGDRVVLSVPEGHQGTGEQNLHGEAQNKIAQAHLHGGEGASGPVQLAGELPVAGDRALNVLREEEGKGREAERAVFGGNRSPAHVDHIGQEGEQIEAHAQHADVQQLEGHQRDGEDRGGADRRQLPAGRLLDAIAQHIADRGEAQRPEPRLPAVDRQKEHACRQHQNHGVALRTEGVEDQKDSKTDQKRDAVEHDQGRTLPAFTKSNIL